MNAHASRTPWLAPTVRLTIAALLGALTTCVVAWWIQNTRTPGSWSGTISLIDDRQVRSLSTVVEGAGAGHASLNIGPQNAPFSVIGIDGPVRPLPSWCPVPEVGERAYPTYVRVWAYGWPRLALRTWHIEDHTGTDLTPAHGIRSIPFGSRDLDLATEPAWGGFLVNTGVFAMAWMPLVFAPVLWGAGRRVAWRKRGRCPACGYDLHGRLDEGCPECGTGKAQQKRADPDGPALERASSV